MPTGPKGEKRPRNPIDAGIMAARIAVGDIPEDYATPTPSAKHKRGHIGKKLMRREGLEPSPEVG